MSNPAVNPEINATIFASAGTGKTWLLVSRMLRLLLQGARPDSILSITFTKKAAAEMYQRLLQRLEVWSRCDDEELCRLLSEINCPADEKDQQIARHLYEKILMSPNPLRVSTFHAFCNDLLTQFPIEAGLPPGYEVIDTAREQELKEMAWSQLMTEASSDPDGQLAESLTELFKRCGSFNCNISLNAFLQHRSDWWAWTEQADAPLQWAEQQLDTLFTLEDKSSLINEFFSAGQTLFFQHIAETLNHPVQTKTKKTIAAGIFSALEMDVSSEEKFYRFIAAVYTTQNEPRKMPTTSKAATATLGEDKVSQLENDWLELVKTCEQTLDQIKQADNRLLNRCWFRAGSRYLDIYQQYKFQNRQLDFADQEWRAYQLLNSQDDMLWVQYKLDQRIEHLLVDEFQDTNPVQWRLLLPLLEEFAADAESQRSVFLVGDEKQSIYAFRGANPELQTVASNWLASRLQSERHEMAMSYRSAPAIMDVVNQVFTNSNYANSLPDFPQHSTVKKDSWGRIEILPAFKVESDTEQTESDFRNPLLAARPEEEKAQQAEARAIADRIRELIDNVTLIEDEGFSRPLCYADIKILLRKRTHSHYIELALREQKIPCQGTSRGGLLSSQEVADLQSLLTVLHTPQDNLALARVLSSPLFSANQDHLVEIASHQEGSWYERIMAMADNLPDRHPVLIAAQQLKNWQAESQKLPLHDLLNKIYFQGNVLARYRAAAEEWRQPQIETNLKRLLALALEIDSGRYPSMNHFLMRLEHMQQAGNDAPSEPTPDHREQPVEILTIHAAKGLEAPVIFLADMGAESTRNNAWQAVVDWPAEQPRPTQLLLQPASVEIDSKTQGILQKWTQKLEREKANLLYVALTRARQLLIISASEAKRKTSSNNSHAELLNSLESTGNTDAEGLWSFESGIKPMISEQSATAKTEEPGSNSPPSDLTQPFTKQIIRSDEIAPSLSSDHGDDDICGDRHGRERGIVIHAMLDKLSATDWSETAICQHAAASHNISPEDPVLKTWYKEAAEVLAQHPQLFDSSCFLRAWNEMPVLYQLKRKRVYGIIDRVIEYDDHILVLDYKTHRVNSPEDASVIAEQFKPQLLYYQTAIEKIWQNKPVKTALLWTETGDTHYFKNR